MSEQLVVGSIVEGKVAKITPFGAIVAINGGGQGLVHISQIANTFVKDINDHLKVGDEVKVKVLSIEEETNRIALSIRAALPKPEKQERPSKPQNFKNRDFKPNNEKPSFDSQSAPRTPSNDFEDIMKEFLKQSNDKMAALNKRANKRGN
jgi:predicted RNA-binding protein with RPS1 domain